MKIKLFILFASFLAFSCGRAVLTNMNKGKYESGIYKNEVGASDQKKENPTVSPIVNRVKIVELESEVKESPEKPLSVDQYDKTVGKEIVKALEKHSSSGSDFVKLMREPLSIPEQNEKQKTDYSKITLRLSFTYVNEFLKNPDLYNPNTRLEYLNTTLIPKSSNIIFYDVDKFENVHKLVDLGTLARTQNVKFGVEVNGSYDAGLERATGKSGGRILTSNKNDVQNVYDASNNLIGTISNGITNAGTTGHTIGEKNTLGFTTSARSNYENATSITENAILKYDRLSSGYSFDDEHLTVIKRGFPLSEIDNETFITTTLVFVNEKGSNVAITSTVYNGRNLFNAVGKPNNADEAIFRYRNVTYNKCNSVNSVIILVGHYDGLVRQVKNRRNNNSAEYDDEVTYLKFENIKLPDVKIDLNKYCNKKYRIIVKYDKREYSLNIKTNAGHAMEMFFFDDDNNFEEFVSWLTKLCKTNDPKALQTEKYSMSFQCIDYSSNSAVCEDLEVISSNMNEMKLTKLKTILANHSIVSCQVDD